MLNYLNNNLVLIKEYQKLYKGKIDIDSLIAKFREDELILHNSFDYGRFRVFIDSCLLLLNNEKLKVYCKNKYRFKDFFDEIEQDDKLKPYLEFIKNEKLTSNISGVHLFYSLQGDEKTPWEQVSTIRKAMAHMQYGYFMSQPSGMMTYYNIYNKDKGVRKDWGIVFEPILHSFIHRFFSNYSYGLLLKYTFFMNYSLSKGKRTRNLFFYEITSKAESMEVYNGYNPGLLAELSLLTKNINELKAFLSVNQDKLNIKEARVKDIINVKKFLKLAKRYKIRGRQAHIHELRIVLDYETEISNFLVHIGQLNEILYEYCVCRDSGIYTKEQIEELKVILEEKIEELKEDENARIAFDVGFAYLGAINFSLRTEDDDYVKLEYGEVDATMFAYDAAALDKYIKNNAITEYGLQKYIIERMRNSLMHGKIEIVIDNGGDILFWFWDIYNSRKEKIEVSLENLKRFLDQEGLYNGVPKETAILVADPIRESK